MFCLLCLLKLIKKTLLIVKNIYLYIILLGEDKMGEVKKEDILDILAGYDKSEITIATLGSHTSLHILQGAKEESSISKIWRCR